MPEVHVPRMDRLGGVLLAFGLLALLAAPAAPAGPPVATPAQGSQLGLKLPVKIVGDLDGDYLLQVRNDSSNGPAARMLCTTPTNPCQYVRNLGAGPAVKFVTAPGTPPFLVGNGTLVPALNADAVDGKGAAQIIDEAV